MVSFSVRCRGAGRSFLVCCRSASQAESVPRKSGALPQLQAILHASPSLGGRSLGRQPLSLLGERIRTSRDGQADYFRRLARLHVDESCLHDDKTNRLVAQFALDND